MSSIIKLTVAIAALSAIAGCAQPEPEVVIVEPSPVALEPVSGKF